MGTDPNNMTVGEAQTKKQNSKSGGKLIKVQDNESVLYREIEPLGRKERF